MPEVLAQAAQRASSIKLAEQFAHAGLHFLPPDVQVELDRRRHEVLLAHVQVRSHPRGIC